MKLALLLAALVDVPAEAPPAGGFLYPLACAVAGDGTIYVVDRDLPGVWTVTPAGDDPVRPTIFKRGGRLFRTPLNAPRCAAVAPDGALLVGDSATRQVYRLDPSKEDPPLEPLFDTNREPSPVGVPSALAVGTDGTVYVADLESGRIYQKRPGEPATPIAAVPGARGLCLAPGGSLLAVTTVRNAVRRLARREDGSWKQTVAVAGRPFGLPQGAACGPDGVLYVADNYARCVWKLVPTERGGFGPPVKLCAGAPLVGPTGVTFDAVSDPPRLLVADPRARALFAVRLEDGAARVLAE